METWKKIQKKNKRNEILGIVCMGVCLTIGIICDWNVLVKNNVLIQIEDITSFSLTILQIQATIGTLIFTIIALITGSNSDSYMGVPINEFYLSIKPWKLTQMKLIVVSLGMCLAGVIFHSIGLYNMVFYLFIATLIAILISILEIYSAFKGGNKRNEEIEAYIRYVFESEMNYEKKVDTFQNYVLDWENIVDSQNRKRYDEFIEIYKKGMLVLWNYDTNDAVATIEQQSYSMAYCFLKSEKTISKEKGIEFIQEIYDTMWKFIYECIEKDKKILNQYKCEFHLFSEIASELLQSIDEMNVENVEKRLNVGCLFDIALRVSIWLAYEDKTTEDNQKQPEFNRYKYNYQGEVSSLCSVAEHMGYYLKRQKNKENLINQSVWANVLNGWSVFSDYNIPEDRSEKFLKAKVSVYFGYCYGMLVNQQENIVKIGLYRKKLGNIVTLNNKCEALFYLSVHCYIYYLAERESDSCVPKEIRQSALNIWNDKAVQEVFGNFLNKLSEKEEWLESGNLKQIYEIVKKYEFYPQYESSKCMIIEPVIVDFYLFVILYMNQNFYLPGVLERNIDDMRTFRYVSDGNEDKTKEMLNKLFISICTEKKFQEQVNQEVELMYADLEKIIKKKQKERYIILAKEEQKNYESKINEKEICEKIRIDTIKAIKQKFSSILVEKGEKNKMIKVELLCLHDYTKSVGINSTNGYYSYMSGNFLVGIEKYLEDNKVMELKQRFEDFADDMEFAKYLEVNNLHLLLGSRYILKNRDYKVSAEYNKIMEDYETVYTAVLHNGIALKQNAIEVCIHDIDVSIHSPSIQEEVVHFDNSTGQYQYAILEGLPIDFEEDELTEFLYNNRKVINITAKISIQINEKPCGTIFTRKIDN